MRQQSLKLFSPRGKEPHGRRCCALVMCLGHLRVEEAAPNISSGGILLVVLGALKANTPAYAPEKMPKARGVAQAKAKSFAESRARCALCRWTLQTISTRESTGCETLDRHLNVGAPTERLLPNAGFLVRQLASQRNSPARGC
jgi:hypothetical protein